MDASQITSLQPALDRYLAEFDDCFGRVEPAKHFGTYVRGLLSDLPRKTVEPIALRAGTPVRTLQEFLRDHVWSFEQTRSNLQEHLAALLPGLPEADGLGTVGLIDETSCAKK